MIIWLVISALTHSLNIGTGDIDGYFSMSEIRNLLESYSQTHPGLVLSSIGRTYYNNTIPVIKLISPHSPRVLVVGAHHARELISMTQVLYVLDYLVSQINITNIDKEIWFVPVVNVDGFSAICDNYNLTGKILEIRKNIRPSGCNILNEGVDLNRNYGFKWGYDQFGSSNQPCEEEYRGTKAFSELETQAVKEIIEKNSFSAVISYHSYGDMYIRPTGYIQTPMEDLPIPHQNLYKLLKNAIPEDFLFGSVKEVLNYNANGALMDYLYSLGIFSIEIEVGPEKFNSFHPHSSNVQQILDSHLPYFLMILDATTSELVANVTNDGRKLVVSIENIGLTQSKSTQVSIKFEPPVDNIRIISDHEHTFENHTLFVKVRKVKSGEKAEIEMIVDANQEKVDIFVNFAKDEGKFSNFQGEIAFPKEDSSNLSIIVVGAVVVFLSLFGVLLWFAFRSNRQGLKFIELAELPPPGIPV